MSAGAGWDWLARCLAQGPGLEPQHPMKLGVMDKSVLSVSKRQGLQD